jgi:hypothetical protein
MHSQIATPSRPAPDQADFELRFRSLFDEARGLAFPCDAAGHVLLDTLSQRARDNYFYARALTGREFAWPVVRACTLQ